MNPLILIIFIVFIVGLLIWSIATNRNMDNEVPDNYINDNIIVQNDNNGGNSGIYIDEVTNEGNIVPPIMDKNIEDLPFFDIQNQTPDILTGADVNPNAEEDTITPNYVPINYYHDHCIDTEVYNSGETVNDSSKESNSDHSSS